MTSGTDAVPPNDARLTLQTLGGVRLLPVGAAAGDKALLDGGKPVALIAYLATIPGRQARRDQLVDLLWSDLEPDAAKHALRQTLWYVKKRVGEGVIVSAGDTLSVSPSLLTDRDVLMRAAAVNDHDGVIAAFTGDFLPDFAAPGGAEFEAWADVERRRIRSLFLRATEASVRELLGRGRTRDALVRARRGRDVDASHQSSWRLVLEVLIASQEWTQAQVEGESFERMIEREEVELEPASRSLLRIVRQGAPDSAEPEASRGALAAELVGREREFALLLEASAQAQRGRGEHVHLRAPAGLGKSRLLGDLVARLRSTRVRVALVRCDVGARELPYAAASELALALGGLPGARGVSPESAAALVSMAPALSTYFTVPNDNSADREALRRRSQALVEMASAVCEEQALVVLIDDVHWMDASSRTVLGQLASRVRGMRMLIVTAGRPVVEGRLDDPDARVVELPVLTELQCSELVGSVAALAQVAWGGRFVQELWRSTGGSPLHVLETLQLLRERELLAVTDGEWRSPDPEALFALLREGGALARRLDALPREHRWMLVLLAVAGVPLGDVLLATAGGREIPHGVALHELESRGLVARSDDGWMIAHDEMAATVLERATGDTVRAAHAALGRAQWQEGANDVSTMRRAGQHLVQGGESTALHALFGRFVRHLRALGDARPVATLAEEMLGRHARAEVVRGMVSALPWHVRAGLTSGRRIAAVAAALLLTVLVPTTLIALKSMAPKPPVPMAELLVVSSGEQQNRGWRVPLVAGEWVPGRDIVLPSSQSEVVVGDPRISRPAIEIPGAPGSWVHSMTTSDDSGGIELVVQSARGVRRFPKSPGDDLLGDVSPDGRFAAIAAGRWNADSHYDIAIVDLTTGAYRQVTSGDDSDQHPRWNHAGDRIAFLRSSWSEEATYICLVNPDGSDLHCPREWKSIGYPVGWIDHNRLLLLRASGKWQELIAADVHDYRITSLGEMASVAAISPDGRWLACRCERIGYPPNTWFVMPVGRSLEARPVVVPPDVAMATITFSDVGRAPAISQVSIEVGPAMPEVGVPHRLTAHAIVGGRRTEALERVRWFAQDTAVLTIDSLTGETLPRRTGRTMVRAEFAGWSTASREIEVRDDDARLVAEETWGDDWKSRWYDYGWPAPRLRVRDGVRVFDVNGDGSFQSGAITLRDFPSATGVMVDTRLSLRITRDQWQVVKVTVRGAVDLRRVSPADRRNGLLGSVGVPRGECSLSVPNGEGRTRARELLASLGDEHVVRPLPEGVRDGRWLAVKMGVLPDGRCAVAVDDTAIFVSQERMKSSGRVQIQLSGSSRDTETAVAGLRIWQGVPPDVPWRSFAKPR